MNSTKQLKKLFAATALSAVVVFSFSTVASADSRDRDHNRDVKTAQHKVKQERKDVKDARKDVRKADTPSERKAAQRDVREQRKDVKDARHDLKQEKREDRRDYNSNYHRYDNNRRNDKNRNNRRPDNSNDHRDNNRNNRSDYRTHIGTVGKVSNSRQFQLRVGGQTYDVSANSSLRGLNRGDTVRVYGVRAGENNINNSNVAFVNNR